MSNNFLAWWNGEDSPARRMSATLAEQVKWVAEAAYSAGNHQRHLRRTKVPGERANFQLGETSD